MVRTTEERVTRSANDPLSKNKKRSVSPLARPFLKWVGGKRQLLDELKGKMPAGYGRYFEPFIGGGALFFSLAHNRATIADANQRLVRTYAGLRDNVEEIIELLSSYRYESSFYYEMRSRDVDALSDPECAAWFIYLNRCGYNGLYRVNRRNGFNVPFGRYSNPTICDAPLLRACSRALEKTEILHLDFEKVVRKAKAGDFVYFDPPYAPLSATSSFTAYAQEGFCDADQVRLRDVARRLKERGVSVLLSNSSAPRIRELYADGFELFEVDANRAVNSNTKKRGSVVELLIR